MALKFTLPKTVRIGPYDYSIVYMDNDTVLERNVMGQSSPLKQEIRLRPVYNSDAMLLDTFLHECLHALYSVMGVQDDFKEELIIGHLSTGLTMLFRDNKWLAKWIDERAK
jgi:hypothetical protein